MFVYQPTFDKLELKKDKDTDYFFSWKSNGVYNSKLKPLYTAFFHSIKRSGYKMRIKFSTDLLAVEQNNYLNKIANDYNVYESYNWSKIPLKNFLFGAINIVKNSNKDKWVYSGYGITFDRGDWWSFGNSTARSVIIFGVYNSSSSHVENLKNNFLI